MPRRAPKGIATADIETDLTRRFLDLYQPAVTDDIGGWNGRNAALGRLFGHPGQELTLGWSFHRVQCGKERSGPAGDSIGPTSAMDQTRSRAVNGRAPVSPRLRTELSLSSTGVQWAVNAYLVVSAACIVLGGRAADRFGARRTSMAGLALFGVASCIIAAAGTQAELLAGRALQGLAAAFAVPGTLAAVDGSAAPERKGAAIGAWTGFLMLGFSIGPLLGGALTHVASWRAIFWLNVLLRSHPDGGAELVEPVCVRRATTGQASNLGAELADRHSGNPAMRRPSLIWSKCASSAYGALKRARVTSGLRSRAEAISRFAFPSWPAQA
jgi:hypothetical protein